MNVKRHQIRAESHSVDLPAPFCIKLTDAEAVSRGLSLDEPFSSDGTLVTSRI